MNDLKKKNNAVNFFTTHLDPNALKKEGKTIALNFREEIDEVVYNKQLDDNQIIAQAEEKQKDSNVGISASACKQSLLVKTTDHTSQNEIKTRRNFQARVLEIITYPDKIGKVNSCKSKLKIQLDFCINGVSKTEFIEVPLNKLDSLIALIRKEIYYAIIDRNDAEFIDYIREQTFSISEKKVITEAGWNIINGIPIYCYQERTLSNAINAVEFGLGIEKGASFFSAQEIICKAMDLYANEGTSYIMVLFSLLGVLFKLFSEAGYMIHFILFLHGKTGSYKTTLARILYTQLMNENDRAKIRRIDQDTVTSIERGLVKSGCDTVTLYDDFKPSQTERQKNTIVENLECIIRMVGDGSTKSRSNAELTDRRGEGVEGTVVVTGEMNGKGHSSNLRCLKLLIEKNLVQMENVNYFQNNTRLYNTFIAYFAMYVEKNYFKIIEKIKSLFPFYRKQSSSDLFEARLVDTESTLLVTSDIFIDFCRSEICMNGYELNWIQKAREQIHSIVLLNQKESQEENPIKLFMNTVEYLIANNMLNILERREKNIDICIYDGFFDKSFICLFPEKVYEKVQKQLQRIGKNLVLPYETLLRTLLDEKITEPARNGNNRVLPYFRVTINGGRVNYIKINKNKLSANKSKMEV